MYVGIVIKNFFFLLGGWGNLGDHVTEKKRERGRGEEGKGEIGR